MANWMTHAREADILLEMGLDVDEKYFVIGCIAPDCNLENKDWTSYDPPREQTHFMRGRSKLTVDAEGFFRLHVRKEKPFEWYSFSLGYYTHLVGDRAWQRWIRDEKRVADNYRRIKRVPELAEKIKNLPETYETLKQIFGRPAMQGDVQRLEREYVQSHPDCSYNRIILNTRDFPDIPGFPQNAVNRKIPVMTNGEFFQPLREEYIFFTPEEYENMLQGAVQEVWEQIKKAQGQ